MTKERYISPSAEAVELQTEGRILDGSPRDDYFIPADQLFFGTIFVDGEFA